MQEELSRPHTPEEVERALRESEERYRAFIANSSEGIWRFELDEPVPVSLPEDEQIELYYARGYLAECNDAMARMYGFERADEITGARLGDLLVRTDPANVEYLRTFVRAGYRLTDAVSVELDREGRRRHFVNNLVGVVEGGMLLRAWGTQRDATSVMEAEERYRSLLENANDIIYSHDLEGRYLAINRAGSEITGYTREEILGGLNIARVVAPEHLELAKRMTEEKLRDPSASTVYEVDIIARDGRRLTLEVSTRIAYDHGRPVAVEGIARDVTGRARAAAERERAVAERERLLAEATAAQEEAEEALRHRRDVEGRLRTLVDASESLLGSPRTEVVLPAVLALSHRLVAADAYAIWRHLPSESVWAVVASSGLSDDYNRGRITVTSRTPTMPNKPLVVEDVFSEPMLADRRELYEREGVRSMLTLPLRAHGQLVGTLVFYYRERRRFAHTDIVVATALANLAASALRTAELYDEQSRLRREAETAERRASFLAEATTLLSSSLDYEKTLEAVAHAAVPWVADWCGVDVSGDDGDVRRLAVAHVDPAKVEWARELAERYPYNPDDPRGVAAVLRTGKSELYSEIPDELLVMSARDEEHLRIMREIGFSAAMVVPLTAHGRPFGAITFVTAESGRRYDATDLAYAEDLARRASLAVENARLYRQAREANRIKDEFLATLSHELRTPLTAILGWASMLKSGGFDEEATRRAVETIERNARAQRQIVEDVLDVSRIITGKLRLELRPVELRPLVQDSVETIRPAAEAKGVYLSTLLAPDTGTVSADPDRLQQVLWNLLSNSVKFTPRGGRVEVELRREGSQAVLRVSDTGQGIAPEFLPHVFERFRQADMGTTRQHGGLGLGLAIVRHLAELHGGTVEAESAGTGLGATFILRLPLKPSPQTEERTEPRARTTTERATSPRSDSLAGRRVLLVEDEPDTRDMLKAVLEAEGASVVAVGSASEAWDALEAAGYDVVVSDIGMPEEDGYAFVGRVRERDAQRGTRTPAVALTAYTREEDRARSLAAGFDAHVPKPVEPPELLGVIAGLAGRDGSGRDS
ncbi:MAG TPA: ATP-binding protein [Pyrinomonadaceae bacterium]|nr:ATP-binding protein [Pyrinomonadaceae bacterium]